MHIEAEISVSAHAISQFAEQTSEFLDSNGVDARTVHHVCVVLDELLTNLISHAGGPEQQATIRISIETEGVQGQIVDSAPPFDPRHVPDPDISARIDERPIGGLGLYLVKKFTRAIDYVRRDGRNYTTFLVSRSVR
jgi:anti-sigma regulatory factor (Ser/Thr protein kinase)